MNLSSAVRRGRTIAWGCALLSAGGCCALGDREVAWPRLHPVPVQPVFGPRFVPTETKDPAPIVVPPADLPPEPAGTLPIPPPSRAEKMPYEPPPKSPTATAPESGWRRRH